MIASAHRASKVLYNYLKSNFEHHSKPWLLPANVCDCVPETFDAAGLRYDYVDISADTWCMDFTQVTNNIDNYAGMLYVHTYGTEHTPYHKFEEIKRQNPLFRIIDDRCLCMPRTESRNTIADIELYSTGAKKQINLNGGGYSLIFDGLYNEYDIEKDSFLYGGNWSVNQQAIHSKCDVTRELKARLNTIYRQGLPKEIQLPQGYQNWRFNILVQNKDEIMKAIFEAGLFASGHYASQSADCPIAVNLHQRIINLFNDQYFTEEQAHRICDIVNKHI